MFNWLAFGHHEFILSSLSLPPSSSRAPNLNPFLSLIPPKPSPFCDEKLLTVDLLAGEPFTADLLAGDPFAADLLAGEPFTADLLAGEPFVADLLASELVTPSPRKFVAGEADGSVKFGHAEGSAYLLDPDIYTDDRISVQSIDAPLLIR